MKCKKDGCRARCGKSGFCFWHDPNKLDQRKRASKKGGKNRLKLTQVEAESMSVNDIRISLTKAVRELENANCDIIGRTRAIGFICGILLTAIQNSDFENRIRELEKRMAT